MNKYDIMFMTFFQQGSVTVKAKHVPTGLWVEKTGENEREVQKASLLALEELVKNGSD